MKATILKFAENGIQRQNKLRIEKVEPSVAQGLCDLFVYELKDIYQTEKILAKDLIKMIKNATADELVEALTMHLEVTRDHLKRLEGVFSFIRNKAETRKVEAMDDLIKEAEDIIEHTEEGWMAIHELFEQSENKELKNYNA